MPDLWQGPITRPTTYGRALRHVAGPHTHTTPVPPPCPGMAIPASHTPPSVRTKLPALARFPPLLSQATVEGDFILLKNQYASRQTIVLSDQGFVFVGSRGLSISVFDVCAPTPPPQAHAATACSPRCTEVLWETAVSSIWQLAALGFGGDRSLLSVKGKRDVKRDLFFLASALPRSPKSVAISRTNCTDHAPHSVERCPLS